MLTASGPVVCGVDFSEASRHALRFACMFATRLGQPLIVVSAIDPLIAEAATARIGPAFAERVRSDLEGFVHECVGSPSAPKVSWQTPAGSAARELLQAATAASAGVIVIGTEGLGRARRVVFGSTTLRVMRGADRPVLAVPPSHTDVISRILCGVDFSEASRAAAREAVDLGRHLDVPVTLAHAVGRLTMPSLWDVMLIPTDDERAAEARTSLEKIASGFGSPEPRTLAAIEEPAELVAREAEAGTLIVLGLGDLSGHRPGSTAMRIMADTHLPVLGVPVSRV
jgi:nucleotide-binding universal stress UspA family protein